MVVIGVTVTALAGIGVRVEAVLKLNPPNVRFPEVQVKPPAK